MPDIPVETTRRLLSCPLLPVVQLDDPGLAAELAQHLADAGFAGMEVVLRSEGALKALENAAAANTGILVGAGTVISKGQLRQVVDAGAVFAISPGYLETLRQEALTEGITWIPGVSTASDCMRALESGLNLLKFFPAEASGGKAWLQSMAGVFPTLQFCPTGGLSPDNIANYLALPNVPIAGGSWFVRDVKAVLNDPSILRKALESVISQ